MSQATDPLSRIFSALADPTRRAMLEHLAQGDATVGDLAAPHAMSRPAISQHVRVLEDAGLIARTKHGRWRSCTLRADTLREAERWVTENRTAWEARFDRLNKVLADLAERNNPDDSATKETS